MSNHEAILRTLGLSPNEAKIYLTLLKLGTAPAAEVSKKSNIHRSNTYDSLSKLINMGLVSYIERGTSKLYSTTDPTNLELILEQKQSLLQTIIPELRDLYSVIEQKETTILHGQRAFLQILQTFVEKGCHLIIAGLAQTLPKMTELRLTHILSTLDGSNISYIDRLYCGRTSTCICDDEVLITTWDSTIESIHIKNSEIAKTYRLMLESIQNVPTGYEFATLSV